MISSVLGQAGAPAGGPGQDQRAWLELGAWIQRWFRIIAEPFLTREAPGRPGYRPGFFEDEPEVRLGSAWAPSRPSDPGYSQAGDALLHSLAVDLGCLITDRARASRPGLRWQGAYHERSRAWFVTPDPGPPRFELISQIRDFLVQSVARPRGARGHDLRRWRTGVVHGCYLRAASGIAQPPEWEAFPGSIEYRAGSRFELARPPRGYPVPPPELVAAVTAFRQAGWFETSKLGDEDLAAAACAAWRAYEGEDMPPDAPGVSWRLLLLDTGRTWSEDIDADARPGDDNHDKTLTAITRVAGKTLAGIYDAGENWPSGSEHVELTFRWKRRERRIRFSAAGGRLSPAVPAGLNRLLPPGAPRLWFFDHGPPIAIVTRATHAEREALARLTGISLSPEPPGWWTKLAPLPPEGDLPASPAPAARRPAIRGEATRARPAARPAREPRPGPDRAGPGAPRRSATAQEAFTHLMRDLIAPYLRQLGFTGSTRSLTYRDGDYSASPHTQKSAHSTRHAVRFTIRLSAWHSPTQGSYWARTMPSLIPGNQEYWWTVTTAESAGPLAARVLAAFRSFGWPAIQAALDNPGFPPDPAAVWARTFPARPLRGGRPAPADLGLDERVSRPAGEEDDEVYAQLADQDEHIRAGAVEYLGGLTASDARAVRALANRLEHDPSPAVRRMAARGVGSAAQEPGAAGALRAAAAEDEDLDVRWEARYALRLARLPADPGR